jgi:ribosomal protein S18 acetylase RimI-like enzyme
MFKLITASPICIQEIKQFLDTAGKSLTRFRYFDKRDLIIIKNHLLTVLFVKDSIPISYGHLDPEGKRVWLGICVGEEFIGQGYGKSMMDFLLKSARKHYIEEVFLKVDLDNVNAIFLYKRFGFKVVQKVENAYIMKCNLKLLK